MKIVNRKCLLHYIVMKIFDIMDIILKYIIMALQNMVLGLLVIQIISFITN